MLSDYVTITTNMPQQYTEEEMQGVACNAREAASDEVIYIRQHSMDGRYLPFDHNRLDEIKKSTSPSSALDSQLR